MENLGKGGTKGKEKFKQKAHVLFKSYKLGYLENDLMSSEINMFSFSLYALS